VISVGEALPPRGPTSTYCPDWGTFSPGLYGVKLAPFCSSRSCQERHLHDLDDFGHTGLTGLKSYQLNT